MAHSAPGHSAAVTLSLNSASSLSDVDECVGDLKRLFFPPPSCLEKKAAQWPPCRAATDRSGAGALRRTKRLALVTGAQQHCSNPNYSGYFFPLQDTTEVKYFILQVFIGIFSTFILIFQ